MSARMSTADYRALAGKKGQRRNKYGAKAALRCEACGSSAIYGGICQACDSAAIRRFDSKAEAAHWDRLRVLEKAGTITELRCQVPFTIEVEGEVIGKYLADFTYRDPAGELVVEDVKGHDTALSRFKRRAVEAGHGVKVHIIRR